MKGISGAAALLMFLPFPSGLSAQTPETCHVTIPAGPPDKRNIFSPAQEADLGDAIAECHLLSLRILSEDDIYLQRIAARLIHDTPLSLLRIRTHIVDIPEANAFVIVGGRVYVSRALLALLQSEDELAGVLAHEFGHLAAHQQATFVSRLMKASLGYSEVGDRRDIFDKYARLVENEWRKPRLHEHQADSEEKDQMEADRLGLLLQASAGYDPSAELKALDRLMETKGKTGNFFTDLFKLQPNQKRLGELLRNMPAGCTLSRPGPADDFLAWRKRVLDSTSIQFSEDLRGVQSRVSLRPPLRGDLRQLRFSPDGNYVLAEDEAGITVLTVAPFRVAFRIPAEKIIAADFTPDSQQLVLLNANTHVERWAIGTRNRVDSVDIPIRHQCGTEALSPDGHVLACVDDAGTLRLYDVASGGTILEKKESGRQWELASALGFSPDGHYFLALPERAAGSVIAWDLKQRVDVAVHGELRKLQGRNFTFVSPDRLMVLPGVPGSKPGDKVTATVLTFPSGEPVAKPTIPSGPLQRAADPSFVAVRPMGKFGAGVVEYNTGQAITNRAAALDVFGKVYVAERTMGELALYERGKGLTATVQLPQPDLADVRASGVSPELDSIALSAGSRGGVWDLRYGQAILQVGPFDGSSFDSSGHVLVDVPKIDDQARHTMAITLHPTSSKPGPEVQSRLARQVGPYLLDIRSDDKSPPRFVLETGTYQDVTLDMLDAGTMKPVWSRNFRGESPRLFFGSSGNSAVFLWSPSSDRVKHDSAFKNLSHLATDRSSDERTCYFSDLFRFLNSQPLTNGVFLSETVDVSSGKTGNPMTVDLVDRCLHVENAVALGNAMVIQDNQNRVLVYRADSPQAHLRLFGRLLDTDSVRGRIAVGKEAGHVVIYDGATGAEIEDFRFPAPLAVVRFRNDGEALLALTAKQEAITLEVR